MRPIARPGATLSAIALLAAGAVDAAAPASFDANKDLVKQFFRAVETRNKNGMI